MLKVTKFRLDPEMDARLERAADDLGKSRANIIRAMLDRYLAAYVATEQEANDPKPKRLEF